MKTHSEHDHIEDLIEGYALSALDPEERSLVDRHTSICPRCREHLRATEEIVQMLVFLVPPVAPPPHCKRNVLKKIDREEFLRTPTRRMRSATFSSWAAITALVLFMMTGMWGVSLQRQLVQINGEMTRVRNQLADLEEMMTEVQAVRPLKAAGQGQSVAANTFMKPGSNKALLVIRNLPPLKPGQTYQVWVVRDGEQQPLTTFNPPPADDTMQVAITPPEPMDHYKWIMVTIEDAKGADHPSTQRVLFGDL